MKYTFQKLFSELPHKIFNFQEKQICNLFILYLQNDN